MVFQIDIMKIKLSTLDDWLKITDRQSEPSTEEDESSQNEESQEEDSQDEENIIEGSRSQKNEEIYDFDEKYFQSSIDLGRLSLSLVTGIHGPPGPGTDQFELVRDLQIFLGPGPVRSEGSTFLLVPVRSGPRFQICVGPGPILRPEPNRSVWVQSVLVRGSLIG